MIDAEKTLHLKFHLITLYSSELMNNTYSGMAGSFIMKLPMSGKIIQINVKKGGVTIEKLLHSLIEDYVKGA
jgi:hypothetical protein